MKRLTMNEIHHMLRILDEESAEYYYFLPFLLRGWIRPKETCTSLDETGHILETIIWLFLRSFVSFPFFKRFLSIRATVADHWCVLIISSKVSIFLNLFVNNYLTFRFIYLQVLEIEPDNAAAKNQITLIKHKQKLAKDQEKKFFSSMFTKMALANQKVMITFNFKENRIRQNTLQWSIF